MILKDLRSKMQISCCMALKTPVVLSIDFIGRNDNLFTEHWTPELAAAGYDFERFEIKDADIVLHGVENACSFIYRISISFPLELIDDAVAIEAYFEQKIAESAPASATPTGLSNPTSL